jgi:hypothetical protein
VRGLIENLTGRLFRIVRPEAGPMGRRYRGPIPSAALKNDFFTRGSFKVENGTSVRFLGGYLVRKYAASRSVPVIIQHCAKEECPSYRCSLT